MDGSIRTSHIIRGRVPVHVYILVVINTSESAGQLNQTIYWETNDAVAEEL